MTSLKRTRNVRHSRSNDSYIISTFDGELLKGGDISTILAAGLPEIGGKIPFGSGDTPSIAPNMTGAFYYDTENRRVYTGQSPSNRQCNLSFSAKKANNIFGNADTVQPPALVLIPQIRF